MPGPFAHLSGVHPRTGLSSDYLNHFNEIVMLLELLPEMPDCLAEARGWSPKTYEEHFHDSGLAIAGDVLSAYDAVADAPRNAFDRTVKQLHALLVPGIAEVTRLASRNDRDGMLKLTGQLRGSAQQKLERLNIIIQGGSGSGGRSGVNEAQNAADALFAA